MKVFSLFRRKCEQKGGKTAPSPFPLCGVLKVA